MNQFEHLLVEKNEGIFNGKYDDKIVKLILTINTATKFLEYCRQTFTVKSDDNIKLIEQ